jgi:SNF2 family DNA or RNA helicase
VEIDNWDEYRRAERELIKWVHERALEDKRMRATLEEMYGDTEMLEQKMHEHAIDKAKKAMRAEEVVRLAALKQIAAAGILSSAKEWIDNFLESGEKLVVFATHKAILAKLQEMYPNAAKILSSQDGEERQANVRRFQEDPSCKLIIGAQGTSANNSPAGVGHTLTAASNCLTIELGWNNALHDQCEDRCHRIGQKDTVNAWYMRGINTIYMKLYDLIQDKRAIFHAVVDGEEAGSASVVSELMNYYKEQGE